MTVIDVDSHFELAVSPEEHPLRSLREVFPSVSAMHAEGIAGDLLRATPEEDHPPLEVLGAFLPEANRSSGDYAAFGEPSEPHFPSMSLDERLAWCDAAGIDFSFINPGAIGIFAGALPA